MKSLQTQKDTKTSKKNTCSKKKRVNKQSQKHFKQRRIINILLLITKYRFPSPNI